MRLKAARTFGPTQIYVSCKLLTDGGQAMDLLNDPIPKLVRLIAVPAATGMMFTTLFNITDTWFAGWLSTASLAALSLSFPVFFLVIAAGVGLGQGTSALIANALGKGDTQSGVCYWVQSSYLSLAGGAIIALVGITLLAPILRILSPDPELIALTAAYLLPLLLFGVFFLASQSANALLVAQGDSKSNRNALMAGFFANIALNPLLMFGIGPLPGMGVIGIALATVLVQAGQTAYLLHKIKVCGILASRTNLFQMRPMMMAELGKQVLPASASMLAIGIGLFIITHFVGRFGPEAVAAYGIGLRIEQLAMLPMIGLGIATLTLAGQNLGAQQLDRVKATIRFTMLAASILMGAGAVCVAIFGTQILKLFSDDPAVISIGQQYLTVAILIFNAYAILHVGTSAMQGLKKPIAGMVVGLTRHVLAPPIVMGLAGASFGLAGIFWSIFALSWLGAAMIAAWLWYAIRQLNKELASMPVAQAVAEPTGE